MKKFLLIIVILSLSVIFGCKKSANGNKGVVVKEITTKEKTFRYVAEDGSSALVTFIETDKGNAISIRSNNKTITLDQKDSDGNMTVYGNEDIEVRSEGNNVTITQGNNVIELRKAKGE